jgi:hypothetical protein
VVHNEATKTDSRLAIRLAALASVGAASIHFAVAPAHWQEWVPAGFFFVSIALLQLGWTRIVLVRSNMLVLSGGILLNVGAVALWAISRTAGAPFGPHAGKAELVQAADLFALLLQIYVVMGAGWAVYRGRNGRPITAFANAIVLLGATGVVAMASFLGVASGLRHDHHAPANAETGHHGASVDGHHDDLRVPATSRPIGESTYPLNAPAPAVPNPSAAEHLHDESGGDHHHQE